MSPVPHLRDYDRIVVGLSGGKDSAACVLAPLDAEADPHQVELHHQDIEDGGTFLDGSITPAYCAAFADALGLPLYESGRVAGP